MKQAQNHESPCLMKGDLLSFEKVSGKRGIYNVHLNVKKLYSKQARAFKDRLSRFLDSDDSNREIIRLEDEMLTYQTECIIPEESNSRPSLLLLLGNPASHSICSEMFFSFERKRGQEHRFWKALRDTGILPFKSSLNRERKEELYALSYNSPFRIGLATFFSMPSGASHSKWAGVAGLRKLFGAKSLKKIAEEERKRIEQVIQEFVMPKGTIFAFQKDAYNEISQYADYDYEKAKERGLKSTYRGYPSIRLFCLPPTRRMHLKNTRDILKRFKELALAK